MIEVEIHQRRVFITDAVFNIFRKFQQIKASSYENGGILMGQVSGSNKNILICRASIPTHLDKNGEYDRCSKTTWKYAPHPNRRQSRAYALDNL